MCIRDSARRLSHLANKKNIQQCAAKPVLCWNVCYVFVFYRNGGTRSVGWVLKTAYRSARMSLLQVWRLGVVWSVQPVVGSASPSWFSQSSLIQPVNWLAGSAIQRSKSMVSHTKYLSSARCWITSLYGPFFELAHTCAIFPMYDSSM